MSPASTLNPHPLFSGPNLHFVRFIYFTYSSRTFTCVLLSSLRATCYLLRLHIQRFTFFANWICLAAFSLSRAPLTRILWVLFKCTSSAIVAYFNIQIFMMYSGTKKVRQEDAWLLKTVIGVTASRRGLNSGKNDYNYHNSAVY